MKRTTGTIRMGFYGYADQPANEVLHEVPCYREGLFIIHRPRAGDAAFGKRSWRITHEPTGLVVSRELRLHEARTLARQLNDPAWASLDREIARDPKHPVMMAATDEIVKVLKRREAAE